MPGAYPKAVRQNNLFSVRSLFSMLQGLETANWTSYFGETPNIRFYLELKPKKIFSEGKGANAAGIDRAGLTGIRGPDRDYDIFAGSVVAYAEADLGMVRPFLMFLWGSADGDPTDHKLRGFSPQPFSTTTQMTGTTWFAH